MTRVGGQTPARAPAAPQNATPPRQSRPTPSAANTPKGANTTKGANTPKGTGGPSAYTSKIRELEAQQYMLQNAMLGQMNKLAARGPAGTSLRNFAANIFTGFRQGGAGNCVTVAAIKAGMTRFGTGGIFNGVQRANDGSWNVTMRDGYRMNLKQQEIDWARGLSQFHGQDQQLLNRAVFYYAAATKRAMYENNDGWGRRGFGAAAQTLNNGEFTAEGLHFLGLDRYIRSVSVRDMHRYNAVVASNSGHAMWVSGGVVERYGVGRRGGYGINRAYAI